MGFRRAKSTQGNTNCQKNIFEDDQVPGHHPRALIKKIIIILVKYILAKLRYFLQRMHSQTSANLIGSDVSAVNPRSFSKELRGDLRSDIYYPLSAVSVCVYVA